MRHPEFPIVSFLSILLLISSLSSHIRAGSVSTIALIAWLAVMNLIRGVNALVWAGNFALKVQVWCDITTKITIGFTFAIPAAALCILRHLERVSSTRNARTTKADKRRRQKFEAFMCFGIPTIFMALHYIVQGHRYDLFEDFGCYPTVFFSVASILLVYVPPLALSLTTFVYAALALRHFLRHRIDFVAHLQNSQAAISPGRYFRLMSMAVVEMVWDTGVNIYIIWFNRLTGLRPWISWENVHSNFSRVGVIPEFLNPPELQTQLIWQWWIVPISCLFFFIFFGFGEEAMADYRAAIIWFRRGILRQTIDTPRPYGSASALPAYRLRPPTVNITLPVISDDAAEYEPKAWDSLSLKMPEIMEHMALPSSIDLNDAVAPAHRGSAFMADQTSADHLPITLKNNTPLSPDDTEQSTSLETPESSSFTAVRESTSPSPDQTYNVCPPRVPALTVTRPENDLSFTAYAVTQIPPSALPRTHSPAISRPPSFRRSISTDLGITVSEAYLPDAGTASRYHEEAFLTREAFSAFPSRPEPGHYHPHGGIRMTIDKSVV